MEGRPVSDRQPIDAGVRLEVNQWNGSVEPRVVLDELYELPGEAAEPPFFLAYQGMNDRDLQLALRKLYIGPTPC